MKYYVYMYYDLIAKEPFYIGKGQKKRFEIFNHSHKANVNYTLRNRLNSLGESNIRIQFIYRTNDEQICLDKEVYWIDKIGRKDLGKGSLLNLTDGGDRGTSGPDNGMFGKKHTKKTIEKLKLLALARPPHSEETRKKLSIMGKNRKLTEEHKKNIAKSRIGRKFPRENKI